MLSSIKETVAKAIDQLMEANIVTSDESADTFSAPPVSKRLVLSTNSSSPDVVVCMHHVLLFVYSMYIT